MKTKKYLIAIAIFGGVLFTVQATNLIDLDGQSTTELLPKQDRPKPTNG